MKQLLIIGHTFPEPDTTGAGSRMMQLLDLFREEEYQITFATTAAVSERSTDLALRNVVVRNVLLNDSSFDSFVKQLNPDTVVFDRYITEEQFGWRITEQCPDAIKILDTEDLHFLRKARQEAVKVNVPIEEADLFSNMAKRELASIFRCDISLIISEYEMKLLQETFKVPSNILYYLPFLIEENPVESNSNSFEERNNFIAIGNLLHAPNVDSVLELKKLWPRIKKKLPQSELHIYGSYAPQQISQLHKPNEGFFIKGWADDLESTLNKYRLQLSPLRFGAGLKGKLIDAMRFGLPSITTKVGAEGLCGGLDFGGKITYSDEEFIEAAINFYSDSQQWKIAQQNGFEIIKDRFNKSLFLDEFKNCLDAIHSHLKSHRRHNFFGQVLQHHTLQSTKYMSKWIEAKNLPSQNASPVCFANDDEIREEYR